MFLTSDVFHQKVPISNLKKDMTPYKCPLITVTLNMVTSTVDINYGSLNATTSNLLVDILQDNTVISWEVTVD